MNTHPAKSSLDALASSLALCAAFLLVSSTVAHAEATTAPALQIRKEAGDTRVYWDDRLLLELKENRFLLFRATPEDELWVGSKRSRADLGWVYRDPGAKGMEVLDLHHEYSRETGELVIRITGRKPQFESQIDVVLTGRWMPEARKFKYQISTSLQCSLEDWYENSKLFLRGSRARGSKLWTEVLDYCIEGVSITERMLSPDKERRGERQIYEWFVKSDDGFAWEKWPKIHIPFPVRPGNYITIRDLEHPTQEGGYYGFLDKNQGGWMTQIIKAPAPVIYELCWSRFDVHISLEGAIPPRHSQTDLTLTFAMDFVPVAPARAQDIINRAVEPNWRDAPEYQDLPLFSWENRFDRVITDVPSEDTSNQTLWWPSDYLCFRDATMGFDDTYSVSIKRTEAAQKTSAWTTLSWAQPFNKRPKHNRRFRFSAMVKTADCTGKVRLGHYSSIENLGDMYYGGRKSHRQDGTRVTEGLVWEYSEAVTGTTDWTPVTLEFVVNHHGSTLVLEHTGTGQCWFDNVVIEDLGKGAPQTGS